MGKAGVYTCAVREQGRNRLRRNRTSKASTLLLLTHTTSHHSGYMTNSDKIDHKVTSCSPMDDDCLKFMLNAYTTAAL